ncbi:MAG: gluconate 2-dehydrogenase subunit 3 family protein [Vicinamibacteria bacterium]
MGPILTSPDALVRESFGRREFLRRGSGALLLALGGALPGCSGRRDETGGPGPFRETERDVLRAICARLLPVGGRAPGAPAIDVAGRMERLLDELGATSDFRRLLALFEWSPLLFEANPHRFTQLSPGGQDRVLHGWAASRLGFRRSGFVAIKRLAMSLYYTRPESWPAIGFPGPWLQS